MKHLKLFLFGYLLGLFCSLLSLFYAVGSHNEELLRTNYIIKMLKLFNYGFSSADDIGNFVGSVIGLALIPFLILEFIFRKKKPKA